ncbi:FecR family protein [Bacteroides pyogenes]|uniref:FecR family protein n=1 Tax=Bacteroides pyogenes TaxID=310300 RepID=UPI001DFC0FFE|nr:hypothetical protein [Bacteroides pyogenes]MBR8717512.1 hypothetical protein [Bacteroides pyogenes]MBR8725688.1 hypothetical protein [Bacteroides pyogenes]MBR8738960.1 hypothetical protein [Bacteroides pyogenes]MBR8746630.1 hypothetical protein [Bacteroides pyogenes]
MDTNNLNTDANELLRRAEAISEDILEMESVNVALAYQKLKFQKQERRRKELRMQLMRYAAMLTLPLLFASLTLGYLYFHRSDRIEQEAFAEVTAAAGSIVRYELPDRSTVWLNSGSKLRFPTRFQSSRRQVSLQGEAYFEVSADKESPFYVNTPTGLNVYVYGTRFNVSAYEDDDCVETVLEEGKVNVIFPHSGHQYSLAPGEYLSYDKLTGKAFKEPVDVYEKVAWKDGKMIFRNSSLEDIFKRLERHFNVDIAFRNHSNKEYKYRATFRSETLPQILDYLAKSANLKWSVEESEQQADGTFTQKRIIIDLY